MLRCLDVCNRGRGVEGGACLPLSLLVIMNMHLAKAVLMLVVFIDSRIRRDKNVPIIQKARAIEIKC